MAGITGDGSALSDEPAVAGRRHIPVPKGPVEVW